MSLAEALEEVIKQTPPQCRTCAWYSTLSTEDKNVFNEWVAQGSPTGQLRKACERMGLNISRTSFREHLAGHHSK
jgi:hypothetical protein